MRNTTLCYIEKDGKYLMMLRNKKKHDENAGKWIGVGGHVEPDESVIQCLRREVIEETGLVLIDQRPRGIIDFISDEWGYERMFLFTSDSFKGELPSLPDGTVTVDCNEGELRWIDKVDILSLNLWEGDRLFLKKLADGDPFFFMELRYEGDELVSHITGGRTFAEKVYEQVARIPLGKTSTYGEIACLAGHPGAARAVGNALHVNPYEGIIPCHRVLNSKGEPAPGFVFGGPEQQRRLLEAEGVKFDIHGKIKKCLNNMNFFSHED